MIASARNRLARPERTVDGPNRRRGPETAATVAPAASSAAADEGELRGVHDALAVDVVAPGADDGRRREERQRRFGRRMVVGALVCTFEICLGQVTQ